MDFSSYTGITGSGDGH